MLKTLLINTLTLLVLSSLGIGIHVDGIGTAILASLVFGGLNILGLITLFIVPFFFLHVFGIAIYEGILLWLTSLIVSGVVITSFWWAVLVVIILGVVNIIFSSPPKNAR